MTEEEKRDVIEKAARAIHTGPSWTHEATVYNTVCIDQAEAALDAVDYFTLRARLDALVEAGERLVNNEGWGTWMYREGQRIEHDAEVLRTALTAAKGQYHD